MPESERPGLAMGTRGASIGRHPPRLGVVIVSWNVRRLLERCLTSLRTSTVDARVVVIDNASSDGTAAWLLGLNPPVELIANSTNLGYSRAVNQGLARLGILADGQASTVPSMEAVLLLNPDTELCPGALAKMWSALASDGRIGCVGPRLIYPDGRHQPSVRRFPTPLVALMESTPLAWHWPRNPVARRYQMLDVDPLEPRTVDWVTGAAMLFRVQALCEVGGLDESFFMYSEEVDLCRRMAAKGWLVHYEPAAVVIHHEAASSDQIAAQRHLLFHQSRVAYVAKHHGTRAARWVSLGVRVQFLLELVLEAAKFALGHKRSVRKARIAAYWSVFRTLGVGDQHGLPNVLRAEAPTT